MSMNRFRTPLDRSMKKASQATCISKKQWFSALWILLTYWALGFGGRVTFFACACLVVSDSLQPYRLHPPGSPVHGILQARILEWVVTSSSKGSSWPRNWTWVSCISWIGRWTPVSHLGIQVTFNFSRPVIYSYSKLWKDFFLNIQLCKDIAAVIALHSATSHNQTTFPSVPCS